MAVAISHRKSGNPHVDIGAQAACRPDGGWTNTIIILLILIAQLAPSYLSRDTNLYWTCRVQCVQ